MARELDAIERCAYCQEYVPITRIEIESTTGPEAFLRASVAVCDDCLEDQR